MKSTLLIHGLWFLPENKTHRVPGSLNYDPEKGAFLELIGSFNNDKFKLPFNTFDEIEFIQGISTDSEEITLYKSFRTSRVTTQKKGNEVGPISEKYYSNFILKGHYFENENELKFHSIRSSIENFEEWVNITGFKHFENLKNCSDSFLRLDYELPKNIEFELNTNNTGKIIFMKTFPSYYSVKHEFITQKVEFEINSTEKIDLNQILKLSTQFKNFIILGLYENSRTNSIVLFNNEITKEIGNEKYRKSIELFRKNPRRKESQKKIFEMLFSYSDIESYFPQAIKSWFEKYDDLSPALNLLVDQFYRESIFTENNFLNLAQAAEVLHSRLYNHAKIPPNEYTKMKEEILEFAPAKYHDWLKEQFIFGNHLNLDQRLNELFDKYWNESLEEIIKDKKNFIKKVKHLRNYYTHYSRSLERKKVTERELLFISQKLQLILVIAFMNEIGFPKNIIDELIKKSENNIFYYLKKM